MFIVNEGVQLVPGLVLQGVQHIRKEAVSTWLSSHWASLTTQRAASGTHLVLISVTAAVTVICWSCFVALPAVRATWCKTRSSPTSALHGVVLAL